MHSLMHAFWDEWRENSDLGSLQIFDPKANGNLPLRVPKYDVTNAAFLEVLFLLVLSELWLVGALQSYREQKRP